MSIGKKILGIAGTVAGVAALAFLASRNNDNGIDDWLKHASDDELSDGYESRRQQWIKDGFNNGTGEKTLEMKKIDAEISRRSAEKWAKDPHRNTDPNFRWTDANRWDKD